MGTPVVISENGFGTPVTESTSGTPVTVAENGFGTPVIVVESGGTPVTFDPPLPEPDP